MVSINDLTVSAVESMALPGSGFLFIYTLFDGRRLSHAYWRLITSN
jgi:hypothetical protein